MTQLEFFKTIEAFYQRAMEIVREKNNDYSEVANPYSNFEIQAWFTGTTSEQAIMGDIARKMARIKELVVNKKTAAVKDESVKDTLRDLANYCAILAAYLESKK